MPFLLRFVRIWRNNIHINEIRLQFSWFYSYSYSFVSQWVLPQEENLSRNEVIIFPSVTGLVSPIRLLYLEVRDHWQYLLVCNNSCTFYDKLYIGYNWRAISVRNHYFPPFNQHISDHRLYSFNKTSAYTRNFLQYEMIP
jgi:hypothetical protein